jgi:hypothetical protein
MLDINRGGKSAVLKEKATPSPILQTISQHQQASSRDRQVDAGSLAAS